MVEEQLELILQRKGGFLLSPQPNAKPLTIAEIQAARLINMQLINSDFKGGNGVAYGLRGDKVFLYLTDVPNNPFFYYPGADLKRIQRDFFDFPGRYVVYAHIVPPEEASRLENIAADPSDERVVTFDLSRFRLGSDDRVFPYSAPYTAKTLQTNLLVKGKEAFKKIYGGEVTRFVDRIHGNAIYGDEGIINRVMKQMEENFVRNGFDRNYAKLSVRAELSFTTIIFLKPRLVKSMLRGDEFHKREWRRGEMLAMFSSVDDLKYHPAPPDGSGKGHHWGNSSVNLAVNES